MRIRLWFVWINGKRRRAVWFLLLYLFPLAQITGDAAAGVAAPCRKDHRRGLGKLLCRLLRRSEAADGIVEQRVVKDGVNAFGEAADVERSEIGFVGIEFFHSRAPAKTAEAEPPVSLAHTQGGVQCDNAHKMNRSALHREGCDHLQGLSIDSGWQTAQSILIPLIRKHISGTRPASLVNSGFFTNSQQEKKIIYNTN